MATQFGVGDDWQCGSHDVGGFVIVILVPVEYLVAGKAELTHLCGEVCGAEVQFVAKLVYGRLACISFPVRESQRAHQAELYSVEEKVVTGYHQQRIVEQVFFARGGKAEITLPVRVEVGDTVLLLIIKTAAYTVQMLGEDVCAQNVGGEG